MTMSLITFIIIRQEINHDLGAVVHWYGFAVYSVITDQITKKNPKIKIQIKLPTISHLASEVDQT